MTDKAKMQTPIEQPESTSPIGDVPPAEAPAPQTVTVTADEAALLEAYRNGNPWDMLDRFVEKHTPPLLPDDYEFPHDAAFADGLISQYYPDATYLARDEYRERYNVDNNVALQAVDRIFAKAKAAGLSKEETRLIAAYRAGDTDKMKALAFNSYFAHKPEQEETPELPTLNFEQRMALIVVGDLAKHAYMYQWMLEDDDQWLTAFVTTIADSIGDNMGHMDSQEVKTFFVSPGSDWP